MKVKIEATIPTTQYGNLRPTFELEEDGDSTKAFDELVRMWEMYSDAPLKVKTGSPKVGTAVELTTYTGEQVMWNEADHIYTDMKGNVLLSGSKYATQNSPKFDLSMMLPKTAKAWKVKEAQLAEVWRMNAEIAQHWGSAMHIALEQYHKNHKMGEQIKEQKELDDNYVLPKLPYLRKAVESFVKEFPMDNVVSEPIISHSESGMAGTIDLLEVTGDMTCRIGDYKTNAEMDKKKMKKYQLQLSFYAKIMENHGWTVEGLDLYHYSDEKGWTKDTMEVLPLDK